MPRIPDQLLNSVVYLFQDEEHARAGRGAGGTAFLIDYPGQRDAVHTYVVSNIHVVGNDCTTLRINTGDGGIDTVKLPRSAWTDHHDADDVSVAPIEISADWAVTPLPWWDVCPTAERMEELNVGIGDDVFMLGRFTGHTGRQSNQPLARFGSLAMMDGGEKVKDGRGMLVDAYLVEMRSLPGFSGSPVFIAIGAGSYRGVYGTDQQAKMMPFYSEHVGLLGIDTGHKPLTNDVLDATGKPVKPPQVVQQNSGVAIVAPYYKIAEVLEGDELMAHRKRAEEETFADPERGSSDIASGTEDDEFQRFEDLTRKLTQVPKEELDEKRRDES